MSYTTKDLVRDLATGVIDPAHMGQFDPELVRSIKEDLPFHQRTISGCVRQMDEATQTVTYAATVEVVDRMGDLILTKPRTKLGKPQADGAINKGEGFLTANFLAAGAPFLWSHLSRDHAVGAVTKTGQKRIDTPEDGKVWATIQTVRYLFDERIPHAVPTWLLVEAGIARAVSVGFAGVLIWFPDDDKTRSDLGLRNFGVIFLTSDQTELSQAQTPANQLALAQKAAEDAGATERTALEFLERAVSEGREACGVKLTKALLSDFRRQFPLGPSEELDVLTGRLEGFFDMGEVSDEIRALVAGEEARRDVMADAVQAEAAKLDVEVGGLVLDTDTGEAEGAVERAQPVELGDLIQELKGPFPDEAGEVDTETRGPDPLVDHVEIDFRLASSAPCSPTISPEMALARIAKGLDLDPRTCSPGDVAEAWETFHVEHRDADAGGSIVITRAQSGRVEAYWRDDPETRGRGGDGPAAVAELLGLEATQRSLSGQERSLLRQAFEHVSEGMECVAALYEAIEDGTGGLDLAAEAATLDEAYELARALVEKVRDMPPAARATAGPTLDGGRATDTQAAAGETEAEDDEVLLTDYL